MFKSALNIRSIDKALLLVLMVSSTLGIANLATGHAEKAGGWGITSALTTIAIVALLALRRSRGGHMSESDRSRSGRSYFRLGLALCGCGVVMGALSIGDATGFIPSYRQTISALLWGVASVGCLVLGLPTLIFAHRVRLPDERNSGSGAHP